MNHSIKYLLVFVAMVLIAYKSVYVKKLSSMKVVSGEKFDAVSFSKKLWEEKLPAKLDSAIELTTFISAIKSNPPEAFSKYTNALGIGNYRYAMIRATGTVTEIAEDDISLVVNSSDSLLTVKLATEFIYGNAIRDASALVDVKDFPNTMDLNNISEELNRQVRKTVLPPFRDAVKKGNNLSIVGAIEINKQHIRWNELEIIPLRLQFVQ
jgi:predicted lipoprotein